MDTMTIQMIAAALPALGALTVVALILYAVNDVLRQPKKRTNR